MLNLIILLFLAIAFYSGARRGFVMQLFLIAGYALSFWAARAYYEALGERLQLWIPYPSPNSDSKMLYYTLTEAFHLDKAFYAGVAFLLIVFAGWIITRFLGVFARSLMFKTLFGKADWLIGGFLGAGIGWIFLMLFATLASLVPVAGVQTLLEHSSLAKAMIEHTPIFTDMIQKLWLTDILN